MSGTPLALLSLGVALRSATPLSATLEPVEDYLFVLIRIKIFHLYKESDT